MDTEKQAELVRLYVQADEAANALLVQAIEVYEMARKLEELTKDTTIRYATLKVRVEASAVGAGYGPPPRAGGDGQEAESRSVGCVSTRDGTDKMAQGFWRRMCCR